MSFFLKKTNVKTKSDKGLYLQVYESYYDKERHISANRSVRKIGYVEELRQGGIEDPVAHFQEEVERLNDEGRSERDARRARQIGEDPTRFVGHFLLAGVMGELNVKRYLDLLQSVRGFRFSLFDVLTSLAYSRAAAPCSKSRTFHDVLPVLHGCKGQYSYDQILSACEYMGSEYRKIIEILAKATAEHFSLDTRLTYFDCTNFYFEIDRESDFQKKGPSKECRKDPLVGMGLLLDAGLVPIDMDIFPGNESEKPKIRSSVKRMRERNHIGTRTIMVADKGLNCARNIHQTVLEGDGYLFSKSVKGLSDVEKTWVLLEDGWEDIVDGRGDVTYRLKECTDAFPYEYEREDGLPGKERFCVTEKRVATFNPKLRQKQIIEQNRLVAKAQGLCLSKAKKGEYGECSKFVTFRSTAKGKPTDDRVIAELNRTAIDNARLVAGYNMLVTSELYMPSSEIYSTYHNLWRIEETFRMMKTDLDARPVFLQKKDCIIGHFLVCYVTVLLERLLEFHVLGNRYGGSKLISWMRSFKVVKDGGLDYVNLMPASDMTTDLAGLLSLPLTNYYLRQGNLTRMFGLRLGKGSIPSPR